jgi:hypothetical protein
MYLAELALNFPAENLFSFILILYLGTEKNNVLIKTLI